MLAGRSAVDQEFGDRKNGNIWFSHFLRFSSYVLAFSMLAMISNDSALIKLESSTKLD